MPVLQELLEKYSYKINCEKEYSHDILNNLLYKLSIENNNYEKGIAMEKLAKYFLETIPRNKNYW